MANAQTQKKKRKTPAKRTTGRGASSTRKKRSVRKKSRGRDQQDDQLVEDVVQQLRQTFGRQTLETAEALAQVVLDNFFEGKPDLYDNEAPTHRSFRALAQRDDLPVSHSKLSDAVRVYRQIRELNKLDAEIRNGLTFEHHKALLRLSHSGTKKKYARKAYKERLSTRQLRELVAAELPSTDEGGRRGRNPDPPYKKAVKAIDRVLRDTKLTELSEQDLESYDSDDARRAADELESRLRELRDFQERLRKVAGTTIDATAETDEHDSTSE